MFDSHFYAQYIYIHRGLPHSLAFDDDGGQLSVATDAQSMGGARYGQYNKERKCSVGNKTKTCFIDPQMTTLPQASFNSIINLYII